MKRGILLALGVALAGWALHSVAPWYAIAGIGVLGGWAVGLRPMQALWWAALGGFGLWGFASGWTNMQNEYLLATKVGELLGGLGAWVLVGITAAIGGLLAGTGAWLGAKFRFG